MTKNKKGSKNVNGVIINKEYLGLVLATMEKFGMDKSERYKAIKHALYCVMHDDPRETAKACIFPSAEDALGSKVYEFMSPILPQGSSHPAFTRPLEDQLVENRAIQPKPMAPTKTVIMDEELRKQEAEEAARRAEEINVFDSLADFSSYKKERESEKQKRDRELQERDDLIRVLICGEGRLNHNGRKYREYIVTKDADVSILDQKAFYEVVSNQSSPLDYEQACAVCGDKHAIGAKVKVQPKKPNDPDTQPLMWAVSVPAKLADGSDLFWKTNGHDDAGKPIYDRGNAWRFSVPICLSCRGRVRRQAYLDQNSENGLTKTLGYPSTTPLESFYLRGKEKFDKPRVSGARLGPDGRTVLTDQHGNDIFDNADDGSANHQNQQPTNAPRMAAKQPTQSAPASVEFEDDDEPVTPAVIVRKPTTTEVQTEGEFISTPETGSSNLHTADSSNEGFNSPFATALADTKLGD